MCMKFEMRGRRVEVFDNIDKRLKLIIYKIPNVIEGRVKESWF